MAHVDIYKAQPTPALGNYKKMWCANISSVYDLTALMISI